MYSDTSSGGQKKGGGGSRDGGVANGHINFSDDEDHHTPDNMSVVSSQSDSQSIIVDGHGNL